MSRPEHTPGTAPETVPGAPGLAEEVDDAVRDLDRSLRRLHLGPQARVAVLAEVRTDLDAAAADGVAPTSLIGPDLDAFAHQAAVAGGHTPHPHHRRRLLAAGASGAAVATALGYLVVAEAPTAPVSAGGGVAGPTSVAAFTAVLGAAALTGAVVGVLAAHAAARRKRSARSRPLARSSSTTAVGLTAVAALVVVLLGLALLPPTPVVIGVTATALLVAVGAAAGLALRAARTRRS